MVGHFPEALNQHPFGLKDYVWGLGFSVVFGAWMYLCVLSSLWFHGLIFKRRSFLTLHRTSLVIGLAFAMIPQTGYLPHVLPESIGGVLEVGAMIIILVSGVVIAVRTFRRGDVPSATGQS